MDHGGIILTAKLSRVAQKWHWLPLLLVLSSQHPLACCHAFLPSSICGHANCIGTLGDRNYPRSMFNFHSSFNRHGHDHFPKRESPLLVFASSSSSSSSPSSSPSSPSPPIPVPAFMENDSPTELESIRSWKSTSAKAAEAEVVFQAPSLLDANASVQVKKRIHGWHTLGIVGGPTKSIYHGVFRKDETTGWIDPYALGPSEYIRTMASVALCLAAAKKNENDKSFSSSSSSSSSSNSSKPLRFLHMGYGSGSLMRFLRQAIPESQHEAIELDPTVVEAAFELGLVDPASQCERVVVGDALEYCDLVSHKSNTESIASLSSSSSPGFHGICIDVFDGANLMPPDFYSVPFLTKLRDHLLAQQGSSFVVHNFHVGTDKLRIQLEEAMDSYRSVFGRSRSSVTPGEEQDHSPREERVHSQCLYRVDSLNTNNLGGNTILIALLGTDTEAGTTGNSSSSSSSSTWLDLAALAMEGWEEKRFDVKARIANAEPF